MAPHLWNPPPAWRLRLRRPALIATDFDGTLSPIVADPYAAQAAPGGREILAELAAMPEVWTAVVSGRSVADLRRRAAAPGVWLIGAHGNEIAAPDGRMWAENTAAEFPAAAHAALRQMAQGWPGVVVEMKAASCALHYRQAPQFAAAAAGLAARIAAAYRLHTLSGKCLVELLSPGAWNKGQAITRLSQHLGAGSVMYFGDDQTDETVFALAAAWLIGVQVGPGDGTLDAEEMACGAPPPTRAEFSLHDPQEVVQTLERLRDWLDAPAGNHHN
jgi:trehalose-phosphatase